MSGIRRSACVWVVERGGEDPVLTKRSLFLEPTKRASTVGNEANNVQCSLFDGHFQLTRVASKHSVGAPAGPLRAGRLWAGDLSLSRHLGTSLGVRSMMLLLIVECPSIVIPFPLPSSSMSLSLKLQRRPENKF